MAKYLFVYHGGKKAANEEELAEGLDAWGRNPVGGSHTVNPDGSLTGDGGSNPASGYSLIEAADLEDAVAKARGCPILVSGGSIEVAEAIDM